MEKEIKGYLIAVPDKNNPSIIRYHHVNGPRFLYGDKIIKELGTQKTGKNTRKEIKDNKIETEKTERDELDSMQDVIKDDNKKNTAKKKKIAKPKTQEFIDRYTAPKERGLIARIINRLKYEHDWYEDVEDYLDDNCYAYEDLEMFRESNNKREQRFYKRVQAYEDAEDDVTMKRAFMTIRVTAAVALLATAAFSIKTLVNEMENMISSGYVSQQEVKSTLANANEGQIKYAENRASKIEYDFEVLSRDEILDTIIRTSSDVSDVTENRARATMKNIGDNADQKLLETILREGYEGEYDTFSDDKKQELKQLIYEMLDEEVKIWIRNPEVIKEKSEDNSIVTEGEYEK